MNKCRRKFRRQEFLLWGPVGETGESVAWEFLEMVGGLRKGSSVMGALLWGSGRRAPGMDTIL
jgi:hypothetical protein